MADMQYRQKIHNDTELSTLTPTTKSTSSSDITDFTQREVNAQVEEKPHRTLINQKEDKILAGEFRHLRVQANESGEWDNYDLHTITDNQLGLNYVNPKPGYQTRECRSSGKFAGTRT